MPPLATGGMSRRAFTLLLTLPLLGCGDTRKPLSNPTVAAPEVLVRDRLLIAVVDKGDSTPFAQAIWQGMVASADEHDIELKRCSAGSTDEASLLQQLELAWDARPDGICVWPIVTSDAVIVRFRAMQQAPLQLLIFGERWGGATDAVPCYVGTDHFYAGRKMAEVARQRAPELSILAVASLPGRPSAVTRQHGFVYALEQSFPDAQLEQLRRPQELTDAVASIREANEGRLVVAFDASTTQQLVEAINEAPSIGGPIRLIGFGAYPGIEEDLRASRLDATLVEDPYLLGASTISTLARAIAGESSDYDVSTGEHLITAERLDEEAGQALLNSNQRDLVP